jgi:hypothetical protein
MHPRGLYANSNTLDAPNMLQPLPLPAIPAIVMHGKKRLESRFPAIRTPQSPFEED